jgi:citrate lyase subunit beta/citryl-CoA lyase
MPANTADARLNQARTFLFTPGDQSERIAKALHIAVDVLIIDLEDAVRSENKEAARSSMAKAVKENRSENGPLVFLRTNEISSPEFSLDVRAALAANVDGIMLPKFSAGAYAEKADHLISQEESLNKSKTLPVIGLVESSAGILSLLNSTKPPARVKRLAFGAADLYADLGISYSAQGPNSDFAMATLAMSSVNHKLASPIDSPHFALDDEGGLRESSKRAFAMGFGGKLAIHPKQLDLIAESFAVGKSDQDWAQRVIAQWSDRETTKGAILIDGSLVDEAMVKRARQILGLL